MKSGELQPQQAENLIHWIHEREAIRAKKDAGEPGPWTEDPILLNYRFCNVHREDDKVTRWIAEHWRKPYASDPNLWFWMLIARLINLPASLAVLPPPQPKWNPKKDFVTPLKRRRDHEEKTVFNAAYIVSTNGRAVDKLDYLAEEVLAPAWEARRVVAPSGLATLASFAERLRSLNGVAGFMAGQVVADMKYVAPLRSAPDWESFAISGPGSRRGLNRIFGRPTAQPWKEPEWLDMLGELRDWIATESSDVDALCEIHNQDLQNCLCEFDKWSRAANGEGKPKHIYFQGRKDI